MLGGHTFVSSHCMVMCCIWVWPTWVSLVVAWLEQVFSKWLPGWVRLDSDTNLYSCSLPGFCDLFLWWPLSCVVWYDDRLVRSLLWDALCGLVAEIAKKAFIWCHHCCPLYWTALLEIQLLTVFPLCVSEWRIHWVLSLSKRILKAKTFNSYLSILLSYSGHLHKFAD